MNKKIAFLFILLMLFLSGCTASAPEQKQTDNEDWDIEELFAEIDKEEEQKLKPICEQEMIPSEYAKDCYFRELKDCESMSGKTILKSELNKCLPVFLRDEIQNKEY